MQQFKFKNECDGKWRYNESSPYLTAHIKRLNKRRLNIFHAYKCNYCGKFHVGRNRNISQKDEFNKRLEGLLKSKNVDYEVWGYDDNTIEYSFNGFKVLYDFKTITLQSPNFNLSTENHDTIIKHLMRVL